MKINSKIFTAGRPLLLVKIGWRDYLTDGFIAIKPWCLPIDIIATKQGRELDIIFHQCEHKATLTGLSMASEASVSNIDIFRIGDHCTLVNSKYTRILINKDVKCYQLSQNEPILVQIGQGGGSPDVIIMPTKTHGRVIELLESTLDGLKKQGEE